MIISISADLATTSSLELLVYLQSRGWAIPYDDRDMGVLAQNPQIPINLPK